MVWQCNKPRPVRTKFQTRTLVISWSWRLKQVVWKVDRRRMELNSEDDDPRIRKERAPCIQSSAHFYCQEACSNVKKEKIRFTATKTPILRRCCWKTIVSVNQLSTYRAVLTWYLEKRSEGNNVSPNADLHISLRKKLTRHVTSDLFDQASGNGQNSKHENTSVEFKSRGHVAREAGFSESVVVWQFSRTRPAILLEQHGITTTCREFSVMRDDASAEAKAVLRDNTIFGPIHDAKVSLPFWTIQHWGAARFRKWRWIKILGGYQSWLGKMCHGDFSKLQTVHVRGKCNSAGRKFLHREIGIGCGICKQIKCKVTAYEKFGFKFSLSEITSESSHG